MVSLENSTKCLKNTNSTQSLSEMAECLLSQALTVPAFFFFFFLKCLELSSFQQSYKTGPTIIPSHRKKVKPRELTSTARAQHSQTSSLGFLAIFELNQTLRFFFYILILI